MSEMELGSQKPSQLLRKMKDLARDNIPDDTLKLLWENLLTSTVRAVLAVTECKELSKLAAVDNDVLETTGSNTVSSVSQQPGTSTSSEMSILAEIAKLSARFDELKNRTMRQSRSRTRYQRSRSQSQQDRSNSRRRTPQDPEWLCFYHFRFADKARKCVEPCTWKKNEGN